MRGTIRLLCALISMLVATHARDAAASDSQRFHVAIGGGVRGLTTMSYSDVRPLMRQEAGAELEFGYRPSPNVAIVTAGYFGGGWFDFSGPAANGKIEDWGWRVRLGLDRMLPLSDRTSAWFGMGGEYGETRSLLESQPVGAANELHDAGPEVSHVGGYARSGISTHLGGSVHGYMQVAASLYHAHARQPALLTDYNWLGGSLEASVGLRFQFGQY